MERKIFLCYILALMFGMNLFANSKSKDFYVNENMRRSELVRMEADKQREVFRKCPPEVKAELYRFKIKADLKDDKTLTRNERQLLKKIYRHIKPKIYRNPQSKSETEFKGFVTARVRSLGWSEEKTYKYLETIMTVSEYENWDMTAKGN